jgi:hypothetical protein
MRALDLTLAIVICTSIPSGCFSSNEAVAQGFDLPDRTPVRFVSLKLHVIKITPDGRRSVAPGDYPGLPPDEIIVTAHLAGPPQTELPEARVSLHVLHGAHGKPLHRHIFEGLAFNRKGAAKQMTSIRKRLCGPLLIRARHKESRINLSTNVAC